MTTEKLATQVDSSKNNIIAWFDDFIATIRVDQLAMSTNTVDPEKGQMYTNMIEGNTDSLVESLQAKVSQFYIMKVITIYLNELNTRNVKYSKLAFDLRDRTILVWGEIFDEDYESEKGFFLSESKTNFEFSTLGFYLSSTIVEDTDNQTVPSHYKELQSNPK
jgi:hypothetical protein